MSDLEIELLASKYARILALKGNLPMYHESVKDGFTNGFKTAMQIYNKEIKN